MRSPDRSNASRRRALVGLALGLIGWLAISAPALATPGVVGGDRLTEPGVVVDLGPGALEPPETTVAAYVVADLETGDVLAAKSAHDQMPPASTLKILTALTLLPELDKTQVVVGTEEDLFVEGSKVGIDAGLSYSVDLLFKGLLVDSGNDAANALARAAGGVDRTVTAMNALAAELQALDTFVINPSGLDEPGQVTSAYDLALIARAALEREDFRTYLMTPTADLPARDGTTYQIQNGNRLLGSYEGLIGGKTGFTTLARHTYVGAAERGDRAFLVTVMRTEDRAETAAAALLDWAFVNADAIDPVGALVEPRPIPVVATPDQPDQGATPPGASAAPPGSAPSGQADDGLGAIATAGLVGAGLVGAVAALRVRAIRRERSRLAHRRSHAVGRST